MKTKEPIELLRLIIGVSIATMMIMCLFCSGEIEFKKYPGDITAATNAAIIDAAARDTAQFASEVAVASGVGLVQSSSPTNWFISVTVTNPLTISAGADFTIMPTSADTPDGSDPTALANVEYVDALVDTNSLIFIELTNALHQAGVF